MNGKGEVKQSRLCCDDAALNKFTADRGRGQSAVKSLELQPNCGPGAAACSPPLWASLSICLYNPVVLDLFAVTCNLSFAFRIDCSIWHLWGLKNPYRDNCARNRMPHAECYMTHVTARLFDTRRTVVPMGDVTSSCLLVWSSEALSRLFPKLVINCRVD